MMVTTKTPPLLPSLAQVSDTLTNVVMAKDRAGIHSAVMPRDLLTHPIWIHPKTAACVSQMSRTWWEPVEIEGSVHRLERHSEVINPLSSTSGTEAASPHGLLRFLDLDVTMALSHAFLTSGRQVELELARVLRFMGYERLVVAPYDEVRASLRRLNSTLIVLWSGAQKPDHINPIRIIESLDFQVRTGKPTILQVTISSAWLNAIKSGTWQQVDLDSYAHLIRTQRKNGLARAIYAYLVTQRKSDGSFSVFKDSIVQRFAPRKPDQIGLRYRDHGNPNSALPKALLALHTAGVIAANDDGVMIRGAFLGRQIPRLVLEPRQMALCTADILGAGREPQLIGGDEGESSPAAAAEPSPATPPSPTSGDESSPAAATTTTTESGRQRQKKPSGSVPTLSRMLQSCHVNADTIARARERGWSDQSLAKLLALALYGQAVADVREPTAWAAGILNQGDAAWDHQRFVSCLAAWSSTPEAANAWIHTWTSKRRAP